jgi:hypothetical protein
MVANYETTNAKNPRPQDVESNHENWHPRIKVPSQYGKIKITSKNIFTSILF